ncbi:acyl carrier protein [bacterium]|nr:acyl carrier protein [bacterium]
MLHQVCPVLGTLITTGEPLMSSGVDSIAATELSQQLGESFEVELPTTLLFDHPTPSSIADFVLGALEATSPEQVQRNPCFQTECLHLGCVQELVPPVFNHRLPILINTFFMLLPGLH